MGREQQSILTTVLPGRQTTDAAAHGHEAIEIVLQALVRLLVQTGNDAKLRPVKGFLLLIVNDTKGRHCSVEVGLLPPRPPRDRIRKERERFSLVAFFFVEKSLKQLLAECLVGESVRFTEQAERIYFIVYFYLSWEESLVTITAHQPTTTCKSCVHACYLLTYQFQKLPSSFPLVGDKDFNIKILCSLKYSAHDNRES